jgi:hypothetical protein
MAFDFEFTTRRNEPAPLDFQNPIQAPAKPRNRKESRQDEEEAVSQLESWYAEQVDAHLDNRREQLLDCDYYDHDQIDEQTRRALEARNQAPLTFDLCHAVIDWIVGTERRTRVDWKVHPRGPEDGESAEVKEKLLKFISDTNQAGFERSTAFKQAVKCGVGWTRSFAQMDAEDGPPIAYQHVDWKAVRWDPYSRRDDMRDCRVMTIERYLDLDYAVAMFPHRAAELRGAAQQVISPELEYLEDDLLLPQVFQNNRFRIGPMSGGLRINTSRRPRIKLVEAEYRRVVTERRVRALTADYTELSNVLFDEKDGEMGDLLNRRLITVDDRPVERMWLGIFAPGSKILCLHQPSPYRHKQFSLTPMWCYRRDRDGMPYGVMRGLRDPQDEYNKRRSKILFALSTCQIQYEEDAIATGVDEEDFLAEVAKPNGQLKLASGALAAQKIKIDRNTEVSAGHMQLLEHAHRHVFEASGVTRENLGLNTDAKSGKAILAKQQQGAVGTAEIFDNQRRSIQTDGEKLLSLTEQYVSQPMQLRVVGENGTQWVGVNQPRYDELTGQVVFENDITATQADFVVDQQDYRETVRMAMAEMLLETIAKMPPELGLQLLDLALDLTDLPNRQELVQRVRKITGAGQPPKEPTPEEIAAGERDRAAADLQQQALAARVAKDKASATKTMAEAARVAVGTKAEALNVAGMAQAALPLVPAADRLAAYPPPIGPATE